MQQRPTTIDDTTASTMQKQSSQQLLRDMERNGKRFVVDGSRGFLFSHISRRRLIIHSYCVGDAFGRQYRIRAPRFFGANSRAATRRIRFSNDDVRDSFVD